MATGAQPRTSPRFSDASAPGVVPFVSSDNVVFFIDRVKLEREADAFPPSRATLASNETITLEEDEETLHLLFAFVYRDQHVRLEDVAFDILARLAEAAEKYQVYCAMVACRFHMRVQHQAHPAEVMAYAAKHSHDDILDLAAPFSLDLPYNRVHALLPPAHYIAWTLYDDEYRNIIDKVEATTFPPHGGCGIGGSATFVSYANALQINILKERINASTLDAVFENFLKATTTCYYCCRTVQSWKNDLSAALVALPLFTTYLTK